MSIDLVEEFTRDMDFAAYERDKKTQSAVERQLAIIGEALNQLKKNEPTLKIESDVQIVALRNRLVHAYDSLDNSIIWAILKRHLPLLRPEIFLLQEKSSH